tara:strand:- start:889 stop:1602 length:714 start_codon:yes stop_codon:yes gene_type:complete
MKKVLCLFTVLLFFANTHSQKQAIEKLTYEDANNIDYFIKVKNNTRVLEYITQDGNSLKVGDTLVLGRPTSESAISTTYGGGTSTGPISAGGARTKTRINKEFEFIRLGRPAGFGNVMSSMNGDGPSMAGVSLAGEVVKIDEIKVAHKGSKKKPLRLILIMGEINGRAFGINKYLSVLDTDLAMSYGEILLKNKKMTRDEAIAKLKEAKDLMDLGLMSEEEFKAMRSELQPLIMGNN